jgi:GGDEF domain-containing protein
MRPRGSRGTVIAVGEDELVREFARRHDPSRPTISAGDLFAALAVVANASAREPVAAIVVGASEVPRAVIEEAVHRLDPSVAVLYAEPAARPDPPPEPETRQRIPPSRDVVSAAIDEAREAIAERERSAAARSRPIAPTAAASPDGTPEGERIDVGDLGDVDLVNAVLSGPGRVAELALAIVRRHLGHDDVRIGDDRRTTSRSAEIRHEERPLGSLVSETADTGALTTWARWIAPWLELDRRFHDLREQAFTDELTGVGNRRAFERTLADEIGAARSSRRPLTVMVFDIDDFKRYNDEFGHDVGDEVLKETVSLLRSVIRRGDHVFRIGGDEFVVIFADDRAARGGSPPESIEVMTERFRRGVSQLLLALLGRPVGLGQPGLQLPLLRSVGAVAQGDAADAEARQLPEQRLLQLSRAGQLQPPPGGRGALHQRVTGWASWMPLIWWIVASRLGGIGSSRLSTITASPRTMRRPTCIEAMFTLCSPSREPSWPMMPGMSRWRVNSMWRLGATFTGNSSIVVTRSSPSANTAPVTLWEPLEPLQESLSEPPAKSRLASSFTSSTWMPRSRASRAAFT